MNKSNDFKEFIAHIIEKKKKIFLGLKKSGRDTTGVEKEINDLNKSISRLAREVEGYRMERFMR